MSNKRDYQELVEKYDQLKRHDLQDLSADQDLVLAIMNLISIEEHLVFTGAKTDRPTYYQIIPEIRKMRKQLLKQVVGDCEGEVWCISKHLLAASYRLLEVGSKQMDLAHTELAHGYYQQAYELYNLFWGLAMKLIPSEGGERGSEDEAESDNQKRNSDINLIEAAPASVKKGSFKHKLRDIVQKLVNCCIE